MTQRAGRFARGRRDRLAGGQPVRQRGRPQLSAGGQDRRTAAAGGSRRRPRRRRAAPEFAAFTTASTSCSVMSPCTATMSTCPASRSPLRCSRPTASSSATGVPTTLPGCSTCTPATRWCASSARSRPRCPRWRRPTRGSSGAGCATTRSAPPGARSAGGQWRCGSPARSPARWRWCRWTAPRTPTRRSRWPGTCTPTRRATATRPRRPAARSPARTPRASPRCSPSTDEANTASQAVCRRLGLELRGVSTQFYGKPLMVWVSRR